MTTERGTTTSSTCRVRGPRTTMAWVDSGLKVWYLMISTRRWAPEKEQPRSAVVVFFSWVASETTTTSSAFTTGQCTTYSFAAIASMLQAVLNFLTTVRLLDPNAGRMRFSHQALRGCHCFASAEVRPPPPSRPPPCSLELEHDHHIFNNDKLKHEHEH